MKPYTYARYLVSTGPASLLVFRLHGMIYRMSGGKLFPTSGSRMPVLLLTAIGRTTGKPRTWPLNYYPYGESLVVVASNRGQPPYPQWYRNLLARPEAIIQRGAKRERVTMRVASEAEADTLWPILTELEPLYLQYRTMTNRPFPLLVLSEMPRER